MNLWGVREQDLVLPFIEITRTWYHAPGVTVTGDIIHQGELVQVVIVTSLDVSCIFWCLLDAIFMTFLLLKT